MKPTTPLIVDKLDEAIKTLSKQLQVIREMYPREIEIQIASKKRGEQ